jgi:hypothetical protein
MYNHHMLLELPLILKTRRNHALEHATLHLLAHKYGSQSMGGHSNPTGFYLFGNLRLEDIAEAATEAMKRLKAGESKLAIHEGCGTNLVTVAFLPGTFAWAPLMRVRSIRWRLLLLPLALVFGVFGFILSKPLGSWLQKHITTEADLGDLQITDVLYVRKGLHRIVTK